MRNKLSSYIQLRKEFDYCTNVWKAYWRGTSNRVKKADGSLVSVRVKQSDLKFDLLNNSMERGVLAV